MFLTIDAASDTENEESSELQHDESNDHIPLDDEPAVNLVVGGSYFSMTVGVICRVPDSYFARAIKDPWKRDGCAPLVFDRDGRLFKYVLEHMSGWKSTFGSRTVEWVLFLRHEADFYNVASLVHHCDVQITRRLMDRCWQLSTHDLLRSCSSGSCKQTREVLSELFPFCFVGSVDVCGLSEQFFESIASDVMELPCLQPQSSWSEPLQLFPSDPVLEVSDQDRIALRAILNAVPSIPDAPLYASSAKVLKAVPTMLPLDHSDRIGTVFCILKVKCIHYLAVLLLTHDPPFYHSYRCIILNRLAKMAAALMSHRMALPAASPRPVNA